MQRKSFNKRVFIIIIILSLAVMPMQSHAATMRQSVARAVQNHPNVQASWHSFKAAQYEQEASRGGYHPRIDIVGSVGYDSLGGQGYDSKEQTSYSWNGAYLTLNQMIYDGGLTPNQVKKFGFAKNARYYDLLDAIEKTAFLAFRAHDDVIRYNEMIRLANENLERHKEVLKLVEERYRAGVESAVNLDIAKGRLALANVNLLTEESNKHDAATQYYRAVGAMADQDMEEYTLEMVNPVANDAAVEEWIGMSPRRNSVYQSVLSTFHAFEEQKGRLRPRIDLRAGANLENDTDGVVGRKDKAFVELTLRYSIYNGSDRHTVRRFEQLYKQSEEILEKTDREVAQSVRIACNDIQSIEQQLKHLFQRQESAGLMEKAYRQQYELGRRSLLDLLDAQNEYFQARRAYVNNLFSLNNAKANFLAETGRLVSYFNITREDVPAEEALGIEKKTAGGG